MREGPQNDQTSHSNTELGLLRSEENNLVTQHIKTNKQTNKQTKLPMENKAMKWQKDLERTLPPNPQSQRAVEMVVVMMNANGLLMSL